MKSGGQRNYTIAYDTNLYSTYWVAYPLNSSHMGALERPDSWTYDLSEGAPDKKYQVDMTKTYTTNDNNNGHSRGHLIPNASRNGNKDMQEQTFYFPNSAPQIQNGFNGGIWQQLEAALQSIGQKEEIYIVTGTTLNKVGENKSITYTSSKSDTSKSIPVPNYFYKVVLKVEKNGSAVSSAKAIGFWFENKAHSNSNYADYAVSVDLIEQWTGLDFFVNLPDTIESGAENNTSWTSFQSF